MQTGSATAARRGRPKGSKTFDAPTAIAFGRALREARLTRGVAQEQLALIAGLERSFVGKIERGENQPSLGILLRLARALECEGAQLVARTETLLKTQMP